MEEWTHYKAKPTIYKNNIYMVRSPNSGLCPLACFSSTIFKQIVDFKHKAISSLADYTQENPHIKIAHIHIG